MARPCGRIDVVCQNPHCQYYQLEEEKNIIKRGKDKNTSHQRYYCLHCNTFFMETKGTPLFRKHLSETEIISICKHFIEKNGIRSIERITGHHRDTIGNLLTDIAEYATQMNDLLTKELKLTPIECDEFWTFVKKTKERYQRMLRIRFRWRCMDLHKHKERYLLHHFLFSWETHSRRVRSDDDSTI